VLFRSFSLKNNEWNIIRYLSDGVQDDYFGWSVSLDASMTAVVGAHKDSSHGNSAGAIYIYDIETNAHKPQRNGTRLFASNPHANAYFGYSVSIGPSVGNIHSPTVVVGAYGSSGSGEVYVYERIGTSQQWYEAWRLHPADGVSGDRFGWSVDIYKDQIVVGAPIHNTHGAAYVYTLMVNDDDKRGDPTSTSDLTAAWELSQLLFQNKSSTKTGNKEGGSSDLFGISVASGDGVVLVGASGYSNGGAQTGVVFVYGPGRSMSQVVAPGDTAAAVRFGWALAYDGSKKRFIVGTDMAKTRDVGAAYIYRFDEENSQFFFRKHPQACRRDGEYHVWV